jgi:CheY-like chemotaxis protein
LFGKHRREIVAVLLDMMMPVMGGEEALKELAVISPSTPIVGFERLQRSARPAAVR